MISYKKATKYKYTKNPSDVVTLREYILIEDASHEHKSAILKFCNNLDQKLFGIQFEVYQYDEADSLIAKSLVVYDEFTAEANSEFVPKAKLKLGANCASISVKLVSADFDRIRWEKGSFTDTGYEFKRYVAEANKKPEPRGEIPAPVAAAVPERDKKPKKKKIVAFEMHEMRSKHNPKLPVVFNILAAILVIAFTVATSLWFVKTSPRKTIDDFDVRISENRAYVYGYEGDEINVVIPAKIGDYPVARIESGAFGKSSRAASVTFESAVTVCEGAFVDCPALTAVTSDGRVTVLSGAFKGCNGLKLVAMPNAEVSETGFSNMKEIRDFYVGYIYEDR